MSGTRSHFRSIEIGEQSLRAGKIKEITVKSAALKGRADCSVYIPKQVEAGQAAPVVILLHGVYGSHWVWNLKGRAFATLQSLIEGEAIRPMIVATPSDGLWGDGSGYLKHGGRDYETWITWDVPRLVCESTSNTERAPHFIAGLSMGGYGALRLGAKHPSIFHASSGHSSITTFAEMLPFVEEPLEAYSDLVNDETDVFSIMNRAKPSLRPFRFDCGTDDPLIDGNRRLHQRLIEAGIDHDYEEYPGGHEWPYWQKHVRRSFLFFDQVLASE